MGVEMLQVLAPLPIPTPTPSTNLTLSSSSSRSLSLRVLYRRCYHFHGVSLSPKLPLHQQFHKPSRRKRRSPLVLVGKEDGDLQALTSTAQQPQEEEPSPEDLEYVRQIKRVLELLRKNRDMIFGEVKLTIMIEDPREVERRRLLGIEDPDAPTREDLAAALEEVNDGKIPKDHVALRMLAEEMMQWPKLEVEVKKKKPTKSLYARATDTGVNPREAAKRLKVDWDTVAEIEDSDTNDESEVPPALGYGALYLVTAFPVIIGISVVLILFYNSLQ